MVFLGLIIAKIFTLAKEQKVAQDNNFKQELTGNFSRSLIAAREKDFTIVWDDQSKSIHLNDIIISYRRQYTGQDDIRINFEKLNNILEKLAPTVQKNPINSKLAYSEAESRIKEFVLPKNGRRLNTEASAAAIVKSIAGRQLNSTLIVDEIVPQITLNSLSGMGINTLLASGESNFKGSPSNRTHNIKVGADKFNGLILKPGEDFSFNNNLGEVGVKEGYLAELVIKSGKIIPEYGGGLCQVSTTLFRAAAVAGLPILERRPHSFPVHYYNPQGFDATIYPGVSDLRFKNDTGGNILIQNRVEDTKLIFEIFGSSDGRKVELSGPQVLEQNKNGSMKTVLTRKIIATDGTTKEDSFWSNYKSPADFPLERNPLE